MYVTAGSLTSHFHLTGVNFEQVNEENKQSLLRDIYSAIDKLAFTVGDV